MDRIPVASNAFGVHVRWIVDMVQLFDANALQGVALPPPVPAPGQGQGDAPGPGDQDDGGTEEEPPAEPAATVEIRDCPTSVAVNSETLCDVVTANVTGGSWDIPGFASGTLETVNGVNTIFITPNETAAGNTYTLTVLATGQDGSQVTASHTFQVVN